MLAQMDATLAFVKQKLKWYSFELNQALFSQPYIKQKLVGEMVGSTSRTTLTNYMKELVSLAVFSVNTDGREMFYV